MGQNMGHFGPVSFGCGRFVAMSRKIWKAAELEQLSPAEQDKLFEASIVRDLSEVPDEFLERIRSRANDRITEVESPGRS